MAKPQKSTAQSEVPGLVKKGPLYYLKRDWQLYALMLLPMVFIIVFKYFAYTGLSVAFLDYKIGKGYAGSKFVGLKIFEKVFKHRDFTKAVVNTLLLNVLDKTLVVINNSTQKKSTVVKTPDGDIAVELDGLETKILPQN